MKVLSAALVTLVMLLAGLTAASPAGAAPYPHTVPTECRTKTKTKVVHVGQRPVVSFRILAGTAKPKTRVLVTAVRTSPKPKQVKWSVARPYRGHRMLWLLTRLPAGKYKLKYKTQFKPTSVFIDCKTKGTVKVVR